MNILDMHCDTITRLFHEKEKETDSGSKKETLRENCGHLDLVRMKDSGYLLQNFALFVNQSKYPKVWEQVQKYAVFYQNEIGKNSDLIAPVLGYEDIAKNQAEGKMSAFLTVEEGAVCEGKLERLKELYDMGVRMMTLTWNFENEIGFPNTVMRNLADDKKGLTEVGKEFIVKMQEMGMIVDVSHLSDAGFRDVYANTTKPFVASHSNARAIAGHVRNMTDEMIRMLSERGGVMGLNFCPDFLFWEFGELPEDENEITKLTAEHEVTKEAHKELYLQDVVRHAKHIENVGGIEVLGLGSDFDGIPLNPSLRGVQDMGQLWDALHKGGFSQDKIDQIFSGNVLRVYKECL